VYEIDLYEIKEPILCCPNDPDDAKPLSQVAGARIDEVFIGSCMTPLATYLLPHGDSFAGPHCRHRRLYTTNTLPGRLHPPV
jgi:hypothetical protein